MSEVEQTEKRPEEWANVGHLTYGRTVYTVEHNVVDTGDGRPVVAAYRLTGPRGGQYVLLRNADTPSDLFAVNAKRFTATQPFGNGWFTDKNGTLEHTW